MQVTLLRKNHKHPEMGQLDFFLTSRQFYTGRAVQITGKKLISCYPVERSLKINL